MGHVITFIIANGHWCKSHVVNLLCSPKPASGALYEEDDFLIMTTAEKEKYKCLLPSLSKGDEVKHCTQFNSVMSSQGITQLIRYSEVSLVV